MSMFTRGGQDDFPPSAGGPPEPLDIPEPRILRVTELNEDNVTWHDVDYEAHIVQNTEGGGLNLLRIIEIEVGVPGQHLVMGFAAGEWRRVREIRDLSRTSRLTLH